MTAAIVLNAVLCQSAINIDESLTDTIDPTIPSVPVPSSTGAKYVFGTNADAATKTFHGEVTLVAGVATLDLTALVSAYVGSRSMTGLKLLLFYAQADEANTNPVTIVPGAVNPYTGWATGLIVNPGDPQLLGPLKKANQIAVDGTHKTIDFASAMAAAKVTIVMVFG